MPANDRDEEILQELRKIRELLTPKPTPPPPKGFIAEFKDFVSKYKVIGLAIAFILGLYLGELVKALVDGLLMPLVGLVLPGGDWATAKVWIFSPGMVLSALITFLIVCFVMFIVVKLTKRWGIE